MAWSMVQIAGHQYICSKTAHSRSIACTLTSPPIPSMEKVVLAMERGTAFLVSRSILDFNRSPPLMLSSRIILHKDFRMLLAPHRKVFSPLPVPAVVVACRRNLSTQATNEVSDSSSVDSILINSMEKKIKEQLQAESVTVKDAYGDGRHVSIDVISSAFEGQSTLNRQRMVYKAIWEELQSTVHAVDHMTTRTPTEA